MNDWPSLRELVYGNGADLSSWMLDLDLIVPSSALLDDADNQAYWGSILASVESKNNNGVYVPRPSCLRYHVDVCLFSPTSMTDVWSRMVSYHFLNGTTRDNFYTNDTSHGAGQLWSQMSLLPNFQNNTMPFPIVAVDSRQAGSGLATTLNSTVYEVRTRITSEGIHFDLEWSRLRLLNLARGIRAFQRCYHCGLLGHI
jgi:lysophospholipase